MGSSRTPRTDRSIPRGSSRTAQGRPVVAWFCAGLLAVTVFATLWVGIRGALAATHLLSATATAAELAAGFQEDGTLSEDIADKLSDDTSAARSLTSDPIWKVVSTAPWIGPQLTAVSAVSASADIAASEALPVLAAQGSIDLTSLTPRAGRIDAAAIAGLQEPLATASEALARSAAAVDPVQVGALLAPLAEQVTEYRSLVEGAASGADAANRAAQLAPGMLGVDEPRQYLLLFQNNAEWRSLGGIPGQVAHVSVDDGRITLDSIVPASRFPEYAESVLPLADDVEAIYHDRPGQWMQDVTQVPDFTLSAELASAMWNREYGETVDGVFAVDTVTLSYLLAATGPISLPTGETVTSENAVPLLLNEVYYRYPSPTDQDAFFDAVAGTVFTSLTAGSPQPAPLLDALTRAGSERRLLAWSADAGEQTVIVGTTLAGSLPATDEEQATFGVYLNDGTGSKMDYYQTAESSVNWTQCTESSNVASLTVTVSNDSPPADQLPRYITGGGAFGVPIGTTRSVVYAYLPAGYELVTSEVPPGVTTAGGSHDGRNVVTLVFDQTAGDATTFTLTAQGPPASAVAADMTPTIAGPQTVIGSARC